MTSRGVCWSTSINPTINDNFKQVGSGTGSFATVITGLNNSTDYYVRAYATNSEGTAYGDNRQINTTAFSIMKTGAGKSYRLNGQTVVY